MNSTAFMIFFCRTSVDRVPLIRTSYRGDKTRTAESVCNRRLYEMIASALRIQRVYDAIAGQHAIADIPVNQVRAAHQLPELNGETNRN